MGGKDIWNSEYIIPITSDVITMGLWIIELWPKKSDKRTEGILHCYQG